MHELPDNIDACVVAAMTEVHAMVVAAIETSASAATPDDRLDQAGLADGDAIVRDYLANGEPGLAFEHLLYMTGELSLRVSPYTYACIDRAGRAMGMDPAEWMSFHDDGTAQTP